MIETEYNETTSVRVIPLSVFGSAIFFLLIDLEKVKLFRIFSTHSVLYIPSKKDHNIMFRSCCCFAHELDFDLK